MKIYNPATNELLQELAEETAASIHQRYQQAVPAQKAWAGLPLTDRIHFVQQFKELLQRDAVALATLLSKENGKPLNQARNEISGAATRIEWMLKNAERYLSDELMHEEKGLKELIVYEPLGVVANISAWNYPYLVGVNVFIPALLAGNAVLYKPSEFATLSGLAIENLMMEAGIPSPVFQCIVGASDAGQELLKLPLAGYFFTGSYKTGKAIYEQVAPKMVPCICEMGGKDPAYITDDVKDIKAAAIAVADGAFYNAGQSCCAVERIYVHENVAGEFTHYFVEEVKSWKIGSPFDEHVYLGPLTRASQVQVLKAQVADALEKGAKLLHGGKPIEGAGHYFEPTVFADVTHDMLLMKEESFGPIIGIMTVESDDAAIRLMNDTDYGLTAAVYSDQEAKARQILEKINSGSGYWNCCDRVSAALPWSGRGYSGFGSSLSHIGLRSFTRPKALHLRAPA